MLLHKHRQLLRHRCRSCITLRHPSRKHGIKRYTTEKMIHVGDYPWDAGSGSHAGYVRAMLPFGPLGATTPDRMDILRDLHLPQM